MLRGTEAASSKCSIHRPEGPAEVPLGKDLTMCRMSKGRAEGSRVAGYVKDHGGRTRWVLGL